MYCCVIAQPMANEALLAAQQQLYAVAESEVMATMRIKTMCHVRYHSACATSTLAVFFVLLFFLMPVFDSEFDSSVISNYITRFYNLPLGPETTKQNISSIRSSDVVHYLAITGTVIRTGIVKMLESEREYECAKCKSKFRVFSSIQVRTNSSLFFFNVRLF